MAKGNKSSKSTIQSKAEGKVLSAVSKAGKRLNIPLTANDWLVR
jgi:hypothetical protein